MQQKIQQRSFVTIQPIGHVKNIIKMYPLQEIWMRLSDISHTALASACVVCGEL